MKWSEIANYSRIVPFSNEISRIIQAFVPRATNHTAERSTSHLLSSPDEYLSVIKGIPEDTFAMYKQGDIKMYTGIHWDVFWESGWTSKAGSHFHQELDEVSQFVLYKLRKLSTVGINQCSCDEYENKLIKNRNTQILETRRLCVAWSEGTTAGLRIYKLCRTLCFDV